MDDGLSHSHSKSAYEMLDDYLVGVVDNGITPTSREELRHPDFVASLEPNSRLEEEVTFIDKSESTGLSTVTDVSMLADAHADYRIHQFLDFDQPLLKQIWCGKFSKDFYLEQVHRPRSFPSTKHVRLLGNGLESLTKYSWWVVPLLFLPFLISGLVITYNELPSLAHMALYWITGLLAWSLVEYGLHRSVFHADRYLPDNRLALTIHFLCHGVHHLLPTDEDRTILNPFISVIIAKPLYEAVQWIFYYNQYGAIAVYCGGLLGYVIYELLHYALHHVNIINLPYALQGMKTYHLEHHYADYENGFGVTTQFWDYVFGTELVVPEGRRKVARVTSESLSGNIDNRSKHLVASTTEHVLQLTSYSRYLWANLKRSCRPKILPDYRRVDWVCDCGKSMYWDIKGISQQKAIDLALYLDRANAGPAHNTSGPQQGGSLLQVPPATLMSVSGRDTRRSSSSGIHGTGLNIYTPKVNVASFLQPTLHHPMYLEICVNTGKFARSLSETNVSRVTSDGELFELIAEGYYKTRARRNIPSAASKIPWRSMGHPGARWSLLKPSSILFRKFMLDTGSTIALCEPGLPPPAEVSSQRYKYDPCPFGPDELPMPDHMFFHLFYSPSGHNTGKWMGRLPKKLRESMFNNTEQDPTGWGVHILESPDYYVVFMIVFAGLLASGLFAVLWACLRQDIQGGFAVGGYIATVQGALMAAYFAKWSEER